MSEVWVLSEMIDHEDGNGPLGDMLGVFRSVAYAKAYVENNVREGRKSIAASRQRQRAEGWPVSNEPIDEFTERILPMPTWEKQEDASWRSAGFGAFLEIKGMEVK